MMTEDDHFPSKSVRRKLWSRSQALRAVRGHRRHRNTARLRHAGEAAPFYDVLQLADNGPVDGETSHHKEDVVSDETLDGIPRWEGFLSGDGKVVGRDLAEDGIS